MMQEIHGISPNKTGHAALSPDRREAPVIVHLCRRETAAQYCLSTDRSGGNIPPGLNGEAWVYIRDLAIASGEYNVVLDADITLDDLATLGYCLIGGWHDAQ